VRGVLALLAGLRKLSAWPVLLVLLVLPALGALTVLAGCDDMSSQPKQRHYSPAVGPATGPANTVEFRDRPAQAPPVTLALLERGQERFRIYCTPCHSELGDGHGMIVQRGFPPPPSYHIARLRQAPVEHFYDVMTNGYGAMYPFVDRVQPEDRWAIAAYIRALQRSQDARLNEVPADRRGTLQ
jgi:mono/diheme cytochrome c family protein